MRPLHLVVPAVLLAAACGPSLHERVVDAHSFAATQRCTQGPLTLRTTATGARWGESVRVFACTPRAIRGHVAVRVGRMDVTSMELGRQRVVMGPSTSTYSRTPERHYLDDEAPENARCVGTVVDHATVSDAPSAPAATSGGGSAGGESGGAATEEVSNVTMADADHDFDAAEQVCLDQGLGVVSATPLELSGDREGSFLRRGDAIEVRIWSDAPNDLEGVTFFLAHAELHPSGSEEEWQRHLAEEERNRQHEVDEVQRHCREHPNDDDCRPRHDEHVAHAPEPTDPPPAARAETLPPRPSRNADWVPGYYARNAGNAWVWLAGFWRVPESDVAAGLTMRAPSAPPAPRAEVAGGAPVMGAVWVPGSWSWSGSAWVWVAGVWQVPPSAGATWRAPEWRIEGGLAVLLPGVWIAIR